MAPSLSPPVREPHEDSSTGKYYVTVVNPGGTKQNVTVDLTGAGTLPSSGTAVTLASTSPSDTNSLTAPNHITPTTSTVTGLGSSFSHTFPPYSVTVLTVG